MILSWLEDEAERIVFRNDNAAFSNTPLFWWEHLRFHGISLHAVAIIRGAGIYFLPQHGI